MGKYTVFGHSGLYNNILFASGLSGLLTNNMLVSARFALHDRPTLMFLVNPGLPTRTLASKLESSDHYTSLVSLHQLWKTASSTKLKRSQEGKFSVISDRKFGELFSHENTVKYTTLRDINY